MFAGTDAIPLPAVGVGMGSWSASGRRVTPEIAEGLPAILRGVRLIAETVAAMPLQVITSDAEGNHAEATDTWQWELLHNRPNDTQRTPFAFKEFMVASMVARGNAYALKAKSRGRVQALYPLSPRRVFPKYLADGETLVYEVRSATQKTVTLGSDKILHIPGVLLDDPCIGVSPITVAANALGTALGVEEWAGRFFDRDATPGGVLKFKQQGDSQAAKDTRETWQGMFRGASKSHGTAALFGGAEYQQIGVDAAAAQLIEAQKWSVDQSARVLGLPAWALGGQDMNPRSTPEQRNSELLVFSMAPWLKRGQEGLHADDDLFPDKAALTPVFDTDHLVRVEMLPRYQSYTFGRQAGWLSQNDVRKKENLPPIEGGDEYLTTPVGGAPNLQPGQGDTSGQVPADLEES
jgi:HK97 family phage portal protein